LAGALNAGDIVSIYNPQNKSQSIVFDPIIPDTDDLYNELSGLQNIDISFTNVTTNAYEIQNLTVVPIFTTIPFVTPTVLNVSGFTVFSEQINVNTASPEIADGDTVTVLGFYTYNESRTVAFNEKMQKWVTFYSYNPEMMSGAATDIVSFKDGKLYRHNENPNTVTVSPSAISGEALFTFICSPKTVNPDTFNTVGVTKGMVVNIGTTVRFCIS